MTTTAYRRCTAFDATGRRRCGKKGHCTHVRTLDVDWAWLPLWLGGLAGVLFFAPDGAIKILHERWVCPWCRLRMKLPEHDVDFIPDVLGIGDEIADVRSQEEPAPFVLPGLE